MPCFRKTPATGPRGGVSGGFATTGADDLVAERVLRDVSQTLSDLYFDNHVAPIEAFAHSAGLRFRAQSYGEPIDLSRAGTTLDIPEDEGAGGDQWRLLSTSAAMARKKVVSDEMSSSGGPGFLPPYAFTKADFTRTINGLFATGSNLTILHGFAYAKWPVKADGTVTDTSARWPGFHAFPSNIGEPFGLRQPAWTMESDFAGFLARSQHILQAGYLRMDVAVYKQDLGASFGGPGGPGVPPPPPTPDTALLGAGFSWGYVTPHLLNLANATVTDGLLDSAGPAFKAIILFQQPSIPVETAQKLVALAKSGLPILVVGEAPSRIPGYGSDAAAVAAADTQLQSVIRDLLAQPSVKQLTGTGDLLAALASAKVEPAAKTSAPGLVALHRSAMTGDFYFLYNSGTNPVDSDVILTGHPGAAPVLLDAWSGHVSPLATSASDGLHTTIHVSLPVRGAHIVALVPGLKPAAARATSPAGTPISLNSWNLSVDDWGPGGPSDPSSVTTHKQHTLTGIALAPWSTISDIADAVGIGTYTTTILLPARWKPTSDARLDLGKVTGTYRVEVNGKLVGPLDQSQTSADLDGLLHPGANTLKVTVATTLVNKLRITNPQDYGKAPKQDLGLIGPATLTPYSREKKMRDMQDICMTFSR